VIATVRAFKKKRLSQVVVQEAAIRKYDFLHGNVKANKDLAFFKAACACYVYVANLIVYNIRMRLGGSFGPTVT